MSNVHVGTMGWSYGFWKGSFYPEDLAASDLLAFYSKQFDTVEVDSTFYRIPREETVLDWKEQTVSGFLFSLKFPQKITHVKMLRDSEEDTSVFLERVALLGEKLGPLLLQLPPNFKDEGFVFLREFLKRLPKLYRYVVEVRNRRLMGSELYSILRENNVTLAWAESAGQPTITELTGDFIYIRWEGDRKKINGTLGKTEIDKTDDVKTWAIKLKTFIKRQTEVFGYYSKYYSGNPTTDVQCLLNSLVI
jgi:uncharacterized protein YecE (DUF72 family)